MTSKDPNELTVGSLLGMKQGEERTTARDTPLPSGSEVPASVQESSSWKIMDGKIRSGSGNAGYSSEGVERLDYSNPYGQNLERVWFDGKLVFALDAGEIEVDPAQVKVAQEYQIVYSVDLDGQNKKRSTPAQVPGQLNIYDSVPGMAKYSPIWQFNYVVVPGDYEVNRLRSEADCLKSGYPIKKSNDFEN